MNVERSLVHTLRLYYILSKPEAYPKVVECLVLLPSESGHGSMGPLSTQPRKIINVKYDNHNQATSPPYEHDNLVSYDFLTFLCQLIGSF